MNYRTASFRAYMIPCRKGMQILKQNKQKIKNFSH